MESRTHLVEVDLLHSGKPMPVLNYGQESHYRGLVSESSIRPQARLYPFDWQQLMPTFWVPLEDEDEAIVIALKPLIEDIYELSGYDLDIDYRQDPVPGWAAAELEWIERQLVEKQLR